VPSAAGDHEVGLVFGFLSRQVFREELAAVLCVHRWHGTRGGNMARAGDDVRRKEEALSGAVLVHGPTG
jgi:hypothetical protein